MSTMITPPSGGRAPRTLVWSRLAALTLAIPALAACSNEERGAPGALRPEEGAGALEVASEGWTEQAKLLAKDTTDSFGAVVAISGNTAVVGAPFEDTPFGGAAYVFRNVGQWVKVAKLFPSDGVSGDHFGSSVAIEKGTIVVGAPDHDGSAGADTGAAYVFVQSGENWSEQGKLAAADGAAADHLGATVGISDNIALAGAPERDGAEGADTGAVFVFTRDASTGKWSPSGTLPRSDSAAGDRFGASMTYYETLVAIGAPDKDGGKGKAYLFFNWDDAGTLTWEEWATFTANDGVAGDHFGAAVAGAWSSLVVGAPDKDNGKGAAYFVVGYKDADGKDQWHPMVRIEPSDLAEGDHYGAAAAQDYGVAFVGAPDRASPSGLGAVYCFAQSNEEWSRQNSVALSDTARSGHFGASLAVSGDFALAGAPLDDAGGAGAAHVLERGAGAWWLSNRLGGGNDAGAGRLGGAVAVDADTVVVGAPDDSDAALGVGAAYVFFRSADGWVQQAKLAPIAGHEGDHFGTAVAIAGDIAVVGAPDEDTKAQNAGAAYVFTRTNGAWSLQAKILSSDAAEGDSFGAAVALSGLTALVGAPGHDSNGQRDAGAAYAFTQNAGAWLEQSKLARSDEAEGDRFGAAVAIAADAAIVGAPDHTGSAPGTGKAYVFAQKDLSWSLSGSLAPAVESAGDHFGASVAVSMGTAVVGAPDHDSASVKGAGLAYVFQQSGDTWSSAGEVAPPAGTVGLGFGASIAIAGDAMIVGAPSAADMSAGKGTAHLFTRSAGMWAAAPALSPADGAPGAGFGAAVAIAGTRVVVGAPREATNTGSAYVFGQGEPGAPAPGTPGGPLLADGAACSADNQCASSLCSAGVCCADGACASLYSCASAARPPAGEPAGGFSAATALALVVALGSRRRARRG